MGEFLGFRPRAELEGFTAIPNEFFDEILAGVDTKAELKIILAIFRKTYGWISHSDEKGNPVYKVEDDISFSQLQEMTGMSSDTVANGLEKAIEHGFIIKIKQGGLNRGSNRYRIRQRGDNIPTPSNTPQNEAPANSHKALNEEIYIPEEVDDKEAALADLFGRVPEKMQKKPKKKRTYKEKPIQEWNCNDLLYYFASQYREKMGIPYPPISGKDRKLAKILVDEGEYSMLNIIKVVNYFVKHYEEMDFLPEGAYPSWNLFYGYRHTIFPFVLSEKKPKEGTGKANINIREYKETTKDGWVDTDWGDI